MSSSRRRPTGWPQAASASRCWPTTDSAGPSRISHCIARRCRACRCRAFFTPGQIRHALDDAGIDGLLTDDPSRMRDLLPGWRTAGVSGRTGLALFRRQLDASTRPSLPPGTAKVTYTSGSTGAPKGVCLGAAQLDAIASSLARATESLGIERHLCLLPLATLLENIAGIHAPLLAGATCLLPPADVTGMSYAGPDVGRLLACISSSRPDSVVLVPELLRLLVSAAERGWKVPDSLRFVAVGGAPVSVDLLARAESLGLPVFEGYGLSECASVVCLNTPDARRRGSVGRPLPHARVRVADDGQIMVAGVTLLGYLGDSPRRRRRGVGDRRSRRDRRGRLRVRSRTDPQRVHHQLRPQRRAGVGRARDRAASRRAPRDGARRGAPLRGRDRQRAARIGRRRDDRSRDCDGQCRAAGVCAGASLAARARAFLLRQRVADLERPAAPPRDRAAPR